MIRVLLIIFAMKISFKFSSIVTVSFTLFKINSFSVILSQNYESGWFFIFECCSCLLLFGVMCRNVSSNRLFLPHNCITSILTTLKAI